MARKRSGTDEIRTLRRESIDRALDASAKAQTPGQFYKLVGMRNPSRSYYVRYGDRRHSLKAVAAYALRETRPDLLAKDFHAVDAAHRLRALGFDVIHGGGEKNDRERERRWIETLDRPGQAGFRESLFQIFFACPLSGCSTPFALEAAHVVPVENNGSDQPGNGLLLRADLHKLFDAHLIAIEPSTGLVHVSLECGPDYESLLANKRFVQPIGGPALSLFKDRWIAFCEREGKLTRLA